MELNINLSLGQARFAVLLEDDLPEFLPFWDLSSRECLLDRVDAYLYTCSKTEGIMLCFLVGVWLHENRITFDLFDAVSCLEGRYLKVVQKWVGDPWWP